jgi:hypothetical protein
MTDFLDILKRPLFISNNVSETGFRLHPQVESLLSLGPIDRASPHILSIGPKLRMLLT